MKPDQRFINQPKHFWANVRTISEKIGYTQKGGKVRVPALFEVRTAYQKIGLAYSHIINEQDQPTDFGRVLMGYFEHRAQALNSFVEPRLMNVNQAKEKFEELRSKLSPHCPLPMNKQTGEKKSPAYLTGIVNMLIEANSEGMSCDYNPRQLTTITRDQIPLRMLARRLDGAFPSTINPIAVWEIKEYYYTTTFGSRVADGIYETLLDGLELEELREHEGIDVKHYLIADAHYMWWVVGRSYLCRIIDMLHMGAVTEVLFGTEIFERLPIIVKEWVNLARSRAEATRLE